MSKPSPQPSRDQRGFAEPPAMSPEAEVKLPDGVSFRGLPTRAYDPHPDLSALGAALGAASFQQPVFRSLHSPSGETAFAPSTFYDAGPLKAGPAPLALKQLAPPVGTKDAALPPFHGLDVQVEPKVPLPFGGASLAPFAAVKPPLAQGGYLEPHYHFLSVMAPPLIMEKLRETLTLVGSQSSLRIDFQEQANKFKFKCSAYSGTAGSNMIPFVVRVFSLEDDERSAVEFQRRSGDSVRFCSLYRACVHELSRHGVTESIGPAHAEPSAPVEDAESMEHAPETIKCLLQMMASDCVDVKAEAVRCMAEMAAEPNMAAIMLENGVVEAFISASQSTDCDVHRCALTGLAHLTAAAGGAASRACELGGVVSAAKLCSHSATPQIQRESVRVIKNIVQTVGRAEVMAFDRQHDLPQFLSQMDSFPLTDTSARLQWATVRPMLQADEDLRPLPLRSGGAF